MPAEDLDMDKDRSTQHPDIAVVACRDDDPFRILSEKLPNFDSQSMIFVIDIPLSLSQILSRKYLYAT